MRRILLLICMAAMPLASGCLDRQTLTTTGSGVGASVGSGYVTLAWTATRGGQTGFFVEQSSDGTNYSQITTVPDGTYTSTVNGLAPGQTYSFRIVSYNQYGSSTPSAPISATVPTQ